MKRFSLYCFVAAASIAADVMPATWGDHLAAMARLRTTGQMEAAKREGEAALAIVAKLPEPNIRLAVVYNSLASLEQDMGNWHRAEIHYKQSLRILDLLPKPEFLEGRATVTNNFGTLYTKMNRPDRAEPLLREAIAVRSELLGEEHPDTIRSRMNLAQLHQSVERHDQARQTYEELMQYWLAHPEFKIEPMITSNNLAVIAIKQGRLAEATSMLEEVLAMLDRKPGSHQLFHAKVQVSLGHCYRLQERYPKAEQLLNQALQSLGELVGVDHPDYAGALAEFAQVMRRTGRKGLAAKQARQAQTIMQRHSDVNLLGHSVGVHTLAANK